MVNEAFSGSFDSALYIYVKDSSSRRSAQDDTGEGKSCNNEQEVYQACHLSRRMNNKLTVCTTSAPAVARAKDSPPPRCCREIDNVMRNVAAVKRPAVTPFRACT